MPVVTPLSMRIIQLKGDMSYKELSNDIYEKTGERISANGLQHLGSGAYRTARFKTLETIAIYAKRPIAWLYQEGDDSQIITKWLYKNYDIMQNGQLPPPLAPKWDDLTPKEQAALTDYLRPAGDDLIDLTRKQLLHVLLFKNKRPNASNLRRLSNFAELIAHDIRISE